MDTLLRGTTYCLIRDLVHKDVPGRLKVKRHFHEMQIDEMIRKSMIWDAWDVWVSKNLDNGE